MSVPFATVAATLRRYAAQTEDPTTGRPVAQTPTTSTIRVSPQPPTDRELQTLDDGDRQRRVLSFWTPTEIRTANQHTGIPADEIVIDGEVFEVRLVERWRQVLLHYRALGVRRQELEPQPVEETP